MLTYECLELRDQRGVISEGEVGLDAVLERDQPELLEAGDVALSKPLVREVAERWPAPQVERLAALERVAPLEREALEALSVKLAGVDVQHVASTARNHDVLAEPLAEARDVHLDGLSGRVGRLLAPQLVDQAVHGDGLAAVEQQDRQYSSLFASSERDQPPFVFSLEWAQYAELDHRRPTWATLPPIGGFCPIATRCCRPFAAPEDTARNGSRPRSGNRKEPEMTHKHRRALHGMAAAVSMCALAASTASAAPVEQILPRAEDQSAGGSSSVPPPSSSIAASAAEEYENLRSPEATTVPVRHTPPQT